MIFRSTLLLVSTKDVVFTFITEIQKEKTVKGKFLLLGTKLGP